MMLVLQQKTAAHAMERGGRSLLFSARDTYGKGITLPDYAPGIGGLFGRPSWTMEVEVRFLARVYVGR
jgi:hypothetical protein